MMLDMGGHVLAFTVIVHIKAAGTVTHPVLYPACHHPCLLHVTPALLQAFLPLLREGQPQKGRIINISSVVSERQEGVSHRLAAYVPVVLLHLQCLT